MSKESAKHRSERYPEAVQCAGKEPHCWRGRRRVCERERAEGRERRRENTPLWALVSSSGSISPVSLAVAVGVGEHHLQSPKDTGAQSSVFAPPPDTWVGADSRMPALEY